VQCCTNQLHVPLQLFSPMTYIQTLEYDILHLQWAAQFN
jgi:hypothetical protein